MNKIQTIVRFTKMENDLSYRDFASELNKYIKQGRYSHQVIADWARGEYTPRLGNILQLIRYAPKQSWQFGFATLIEKAVLENLD